MRNVVVHVAAFVSIPTLFPPAIDNLRCGVALIIRCLAGSKGDTYDKLWNKEYPPIFAGNTIVLVAPDAVRAPLNAAVNPCT